MHRIQLGNTEFEGVNSIYLFPDDPTVLVDTGIATSTAREQLEDGLAGHDVSVTDLDVILLTHYHGDHADLAGELQAESGASVHAHADDAPLVARETAAWEALADRQEAAFDAWGIPPEKAAELRSRFETNIPELDESVDVDPFTDGDRFDIGEGELVVRHMPGHTLGLSGFELVERNEVLTGDALLPVYTPNVGGADVRVDRPLERYVSTLRSLADRDFDRAWPGHRDPIDDPSERALEILEHHEERAYRVLSALDRLGAADPWRVSAELFGTLEGIHILHGPGEAFAHLDHLVRDGAVESTGTEYRLTEEGRARLADIDSGRWPL